MNDSATMYQGEWSSVTLTTTAFGLTAREQFARFKVEAATELALRLSGGLMVAGSMLLWSLMPMGAGTDAMISHSLLAAMFTATGLFVYAYGTRGFRHQLSLDARKGTLALTKINMNEKGRVVRTIDLEDIESLYLRRPKTRGGMATLYVRVAGIPSPLLALTGETSELEMIHSDLSEIIKGVEPIAQSVLPETGGTETEQLLRA